jgi:hypothetical protein
MPKFNAAEVVESLEWDFTACGTKAKGVTPEPSDHQIGAFLDQLKQLFEDSKDMLPADIGDNPTAEQMLEAMSSVTGDAFVDLMDKTAGIFAELCSGSPSKAQLLGIPLRVRVHFYAWVQGEVVNPEVGTGAGTAQVKTLRPAAAG